MTMAALCPPTTLSGSCLYQAFRECLYSDPMEETSNGFTDKLFWRKARGEWHCFQKLAQGRGYVSLCPRREIALMLGQQIARPEAHLRCGLCDGLEMARRGWRCLLTASALQQNPP
jgi:hypothetical protein